MSSETGQVKEGGGARKLFWAVLAAAAVLRAASCGKYLFIDETTTILNIINFFMNRTLVPLHFNYPTLYSYLSTPPTALASLIYYQLGLAPTPLGFGSLFLLQSALTALPARLTSAAFGTATVYLVYKTGRRFRDENTGLLAAALLAFS